MNVTELDSKFSDYTSHKKRPRFSLQCADLKISKRLAGDDLYEKAISLISELNQTKLSNKETENSNKHNLDNIDKETSINSNHISNSAESKTSGDNIIEESNDIQTEEFDDLYGDIDEIVVVEEPVSEIKTEVLTENNYDSKQRIDEVDDDIDIAEFSIPKQLFLPIPYSYQDLSISRFVTISTASKGQSASSVCLQKLQMLKKCFT